MVANMILIHRIVLISVKLMKFIVLKDVFVKMDITELEEFVKDAHMVLYIMLDYRTVAALQEPS